MTQPAVSELPGSASFSVSLTFTLQDGFPLTQPMESGPLVLFWRGGGR